MSTDPEHASKVGPVGELQHAEELHKVREKNLRDLLFSFSFSVEPPPALTLDEILARKHGRATGQGGK